METIVRNFNTDLNFWEINPIFKTIVNFKALYDKDKSKGKTASSKLMWAVSMLVDPNSANVWRNLSESDKQMLISEEYLQDKDFDWGDEGVILLIQEYEKRIISPAEREYRRLMKKMEERGDFIESTKYTVDTFDEESGKVIKGTADQLDKMLVNTVKIYEQLEVVNSMIAKEASGNVRGSAVESASEKGEV